nr:umecyanin-like [Quercus suber]POE54742.1 blue copper protein [Quercus suber]
MARGMGLCCCFIVVVMALLKGATAAQTYEVGDSLGWEVPPNSSYYSEWASNKTFYDGDKLSFNWTGSHTVRISNTAAEYDNCSKTPVADIGSPFVLTLNASEPVYFLYCTVNDHCKRGQKFSINVLRLNSTVAAPPSPSSALSLTIDAFVAVLSTLVTLVLIYI